MKRRFCIRYLVLGYILASSNVFADDVIYGPFAITQENYQGNATNSVYYGGQTARHVLHDSLKKLAAEGNGIYDVSLEKKMLSYYEEKKTGRKIIAPVTTGAFVMGPEF